MPRERWEAVRAVDWARYPGAYGTDRDVAAALEALRSAPEKSDEFQDAWSDVMLGHVWHQGSVYPVTPVALAFFLDLPARRRRRGELADYPAVVAAAAVRTDDRSVGDAILALLEARAGVLDPATLAAVPALWTRGSLVDVLRTASTACHDALRWAAVELAASSHPVKVAAGEKLASAAGSAYLDPRLAASLEALAGALDDPDRVRERFGGKPELPARRPGPTRARVTVVEENWFVAQVDRRNVTVRWPAHPFHEEDEATLIDLDERNRFREVRHANGVSASFDEHGRLVDG